MLPPHLRLFGSTHPIHQPHTSSPPLPTTPSLSRTITTIRFTLDLEYGQGLKRKMDSVYAGVKAFGSSFSSNTTGGGKSGEGGGGGGRKDDEESMEREMRASFVVYANDLDISAEHLDWLMEELLQSDAIGPAFLGEEVERARREVRSSVGLSEKFRLLLKVRLLITSCRSSHP
jgi:hypothetical protein